MLFRSIIQDQLLENYFNKLTNNELNRSILNAFEKIPCSLIIENRLKTSEYNTNSTLGTISSKQINIKFEDLFLVNQNTQILPRNFIVSNFETILNNTYGNNINVNTIFNLDNRPGLTFENK